MVASEATPFAKTGGLADVVGALPKALAQNGEDVATVIPLYRHITLRQASIAYERLSFWLGARQFMANIWESSESGSRVFFVQCPALFDRDGIYNEGGIDYPDNHRRFAGLCQAALGVARHLFRPDIFHCHDWQTGLLPVYLKEVFPLHPAYLGVKTVFTIHNLGYQGLFPRTVLTDLGLPERLYHTDRMEFYGDVNFLKGGLVYSDRLTTVSRAYAQEIQTPEYGFGLDGLLRARKSDLVGILNGVDYEQWDPRHDSHIAAPYDAKNLSGKKACKAALLKEVGLPDSLVEKPLIGIISRFAEQKGFDLVTDVADEIAKLNAGLVVLGSGEPRFENLFADLASKYPEKIAVRFGYNDPLAHQIEAGVDLFLMPSRYEPCGLNQIYSLRYGTVPVVRATGGLDDTIDEDTGFKFRDYSGEALLHTLKSALAAYGSKRWKQLILNGMSRDHSWFSSARKYSGLYQKLLGATD